MVLLCSTIRKTDTVKINWCIAYTTYCLRYILHSEVKTTYIYVIIIRTITLWNTNRPINSSKKDNVRIINVTRECPHMDNIVLPSPDLLPGPIRHRLYVTTCIVESIRPTLGQSQVRLRQHYFIRPMRHDQAVSVSECSTGKTSNNAESSWPANFQLFSGQAVKVVWRVLVRHCADYFVPYDYQGRVRTVIAELTTGRTPSSSLTLCYYTTTWGHLRTVADSVTLSTRRRYLPVANITAPTTVPSCLTHCCLCGLPTYCHDSSVEPPPRGSHWQLIADKDDNAADIAMLLVMLFGYAAHFSLLLN